MENKGHIPMEEKQVDEPRKRTVITEKYLEEKYQFEKVKADNVIRSTGHYLKKYYKPSGNCKKFLNL